MTGSTNNSSRSPCSKKKWGKCLFAVLSLQCIATIANFKYFRDASRYLDATNNVELLSHLPPSIQHMRIHGHDFGTSGANIYNICPSALNLFANTTELKQAINKNIDFHQHGGSLRSIETYLNSHMQSTIDRLGLKFSPNDNGPVTNVINYLNEYYAKNKVKRGGYGQPLPGRFSSPDHGRIFRQTLFEKRWINVLEPSTWERFEAGIGPVGPDCTESVAFSKGTAEEKNICIEKKNSNQDNDGKHTKEECNVVSIGSNDQWGFEEEVTNHPKLGGCVTHTFDCTLTNNKPSHKPQNDNVKFYPYCIGEEGQAPPYLTFDQMWKLAETSSKIPPQLLKMDIEGFEYSVVLNSILSSDPSIWPEQIVMEVHWATRMVDVPWMPRTRSAAELALFFGVLFNRGGYILQHANFFPGCQTCLEVLLVRAVC